MTLKGREEVTTASEREYRREYQRKYRQTEKYRAYNRQLQRAWKKLNPHIAKAHLAVFWAIKEGTLIRPSKCSQCDEGGKIEAHHADHLKPLDVTWLCTICHAATRTKSNDGGKL